MNQLSLNIKEHRKALHMSQIEFAEMLKVSQTSVAHYENGSRNPTLDLIMNMAKIFNTSVDALLGYKGVSQPFDNNIDTAAYKIELYTLLVNKDYYRFHQLMTRLAKQCSMDVMIENLVRGVQEEVGLAWQKGMLTVADEHYATNAISRTMAALYPIDSPVASKKKAITLAVGSEEHTLGIELVSSFLQTNGVETWYLGSNVPMASLNQMIDEYAPDYLLLSITLKEQVNTLSLVIDNIKTKNQMQIFVGGQGAPFVKEMIYRKHNVQIIDQMSQMIELVKA